ncbi:MAG: thioester reductase domain-containing protein [Leptospiraceae bacterium]|nr:thioester reductase domain-containing protein [Leptospiraceae bacterium]
MNTNFIYKSFLEEFQKIVKEFPDSIAISSEAGEISYSELSYRIIQVSHNLYEAGILEGDIIALWMKKSPEYIVSILAIWKLGAIFLPLDEKTPKARVDWICKDANVTLLITSGLPQRHRDTEIDDFVASSFRLPTIRELQCDDVAYIIYTSGSTGNPKGVVVPHEGIVNFLEKQIEVFQVTSKSKILQYLSIGFDASISEIGIALLAGAEIRIEKEEEIKTTDGLIAILENERITHICLPPSLLPILPIEKIPTSLETIIIGGEVCPVETVRLWSKRFRLVNVYGPTEVTVCSSLVVCEPNWDKPLIGNPIPNREFSILDENLIPVKEGESGELYLSGVGLAKEYLNLPALTKEKFPFLNGTRFYKTGDRVLKHLSLEIEFLGRMDRQFKHKGNLIEPMEVERALAAYPGISFVFVMKRNLDREVLVAYINWIRKGDMEDHSPSLHFEKNDYKENNLVNQIKQYLSTLLPKWMIPERFVFLEKIPLNANEKLDVKSLPELESTRPKYLPLYKKPISQKEITLCEIFAKILSVYPIGTQDDFFLLGGDSISMISLLAECSLLSITLSPEKFIQNPTVEGIAKHEGVENTFFSKVEFLNQEALFDVEIKSTIQNSTLTKNVFSNILLTGATGFLGSRILFELRKNSKANIYCIVRNLKKRDPRKILEKIFIEQEIQIQDWTQIYFIEGDISKPNLGLCELDWEFLTSKIDSVFHFAAAVNLVLPYDKLKPTNTDSTKEILKFCSTKFRKYLHYASTLSVFVSTNDPRDRFYENDELNTMSEVYGGYAQSKWVSEKLLMNAKQSGMDSIFIYRFGLITGDSKTGYSKRDDFFSEFLQSILNLKILPDLEGKELSVDVTALDYAANACITISSQLNHTSKNSIFHIANPKSLKLSELISIFTQLQLSISQVPKQQFIDFCKSSELENSYLYLSLSRFILENRAFTLIRPLDLFQATSVQFDFTNTNQILNSKIECPKPDISLLQKYIQFLESQELF